MSPRTSLVPSLLLLLLLPSIMAQSASSSSYTPLTAYAANPYFQVINQTLYKTYSPYLAQSSVSSVYISSSPSLVSLIITYVNSAGTSYKATTNYLPATRQLSIQSFGPVVEAKTTKSVGSTSAVKIYDSQNGIGITLAPPPSNMSLLVPGSNPSVTNQGMSVLKQTSTGGYSLRRSN